MATFTYIVTKVRKQDSVDGSHRHIAGVCVDDGTYYTRHEVVDSIRKGNTWVTRAGGREARIRPIRRCRHDGCPATPYIETTPDRNERDNLENLEEC